MFPVFWTILIHLMPIALGLSVILFAGKNRCPPLSLSIALAYGLGTGLITIWMFALGIANIPQSVISINAPLAAMTVLFFGCRRKFIRRSSFAADTEARLLKFQRERQAAGQGWGGYSAYQTGKGQVALTGLKQL